MLGKREEGLRGGGGGGVSWFIGCLF